MAEKGYRACHLNVALRRDLDAAYRELRAPMSHDDDTARTRNRLDDGATAKEMAEESYRVCRINAYLRKDENGAQGELRLSKKNQAVMQDALQEMRGELPEMRKVLERTWGLLKSRKVKIPEDLRMAYSALMERIQYDWQPRKSIKEDVHLTKKIKAQGNKGAEGGDSKGGGKETDGKLTFLLHTHQGKTYDLRQPMEDQESENDDEDNAASCAAEATEADSYLSSTITADTKRKRKEVADVSSKRIKSNPAVSDFWKSKINLSAHETWDGSVALNAPPFPFKQSWDPATKAMHMRERKAREVEGTNLEDGEILE
jgi:hypothetical protein